MANPLTSEERQEQLLPYSSISGLSTLPLFLCRAYLLPLTVIFAEYGTIGLSACGAGTFGGLLLTLFALRIGAGLFENANLFGDQLLTLFVIGTAILALANTCEVYARDWRRDKIHRASPGTPRRYLVDWLLPASWAENDVKLWTVVFPAISILFGVVALNHSPALGCYCLLGGVVMALQGAYVFWQERQILMARRDHIRVEEPRRRFFTEQQDANGNKAVGGVVTSVSTARTDETPSSMNRAFRDLAPEFHSVMDLSLVQPPAPQPALVRVHCPHCGKALKGPVAHANRNVRCPECRTCFVLTEELLS